MNNLRRKIGSTWHIIIWLSGVILIFWSASQPDYYWMVATTENPVLSFPWAGALTFSALITAETMALFMILRPASYYRSWIRALLSLSFICALILYFLLGLLDGSDYYVAHIQWLLGVAVCLWLLFFWSTTSHFFKTTNDPLKNEDEFDYQDNEKQIQSRRIEPVSFE